jgi:hypothetical protein
MQNSTAADAGYSDRPGPSGKFVGILHNQFALKLPVIGSSTVQSNDFQNFKSGVVERYRCRDAQLIVTAELQADMAAYFQRKIKLFGFSVHPDVYDLCLILEYMLQNRFGSITVR